MDIARAEKKVACPDGNDASPSPTLRSGVTFIKVNSGRGAK